MADENSVESLREHRDKLRTELDQLKDKTAKLTKNYDPQWSAPVAILKAHQRFEQEAEAKKKQLKDRIEAINELQKLYSAEVESGRLASVAQQIITKCENKMVKAEESGDFEAAALAEMVAGDLHRAMQLNS